MRLRTAALGLVSVTLLLGEGTSTKPKPEDYSVHTKLKTLALGANYMVHSVSLQNQTFVAEDYLVVEVALFPASGQNLVVSSGQFTLHRNGKKRGLMSQAPSLVAVSLKHPDWRRGPALEAGGGLGNAGVIIGRPRPTERFPGDPDPSRTTRKPPVSLPEPDDPGAAANKPELTAENAVVEAALPECETRYPVSGYLYFPFKGKIKSIHSLELVYTGLAGEAKLKLL